MIARLAASCTVRQPEELALNERWHLELVKAEHGQSKKYKNTCKTTQHPWILQVRRQHRSGQTSSDPGQSVRQCHRQNINQRQTKGMPTT